MIDKIITRPENQKQRNLIFRRTQTADINEDSTIVVIHVLDLFENFLFKEVVDQSELLNLKTEIELIEYFKPFIRENQLNENGIYLFQLFFVNDEFKYKQNPDNEFIVTEISSDRTEVRLNPKSNEQQFIDKFNLFKQYYYINQPNPLDDFEKFIDTFITSYLSNFYNKIGDAFVRDIISIRYNSSDYNINEYIDGALTEYNDPITLNILTALDEELQSTRSKVKNTLFDTLINDVLINDRYRTYIKYVNRRRDNKISSTTNDDEYQTGGGTPISNNTNSLPGTLGFNNNEFRTGGPTPISGASPISPISNNNDDKFETGGPDPVDDDNKDNGFPPGFNNEGDSNKQRSIDEIINITRNRLFEVIQNKLSVSLVSTILDNFKPVNALTNFEL